jgi:hypothetical protein
MSEVLTELSTEVSTEESTERCGETTRQRGDETSHLWQGRPADAGGNGLLSGIAT